MREGPVRQIIFPPELGVEACVEINQCATFVNLRVDGKAVTATTSRRWRGTLKFDFMYPMVGDQRVRQDGGPVPSPHCNHYVVLGVEGPRLRAHLEVGQRRRS